METHFPRIGTVRIPPKFANVFDFCRLGALLSAFGAVLGPPVSRPRAAGEAPEGHFGQFFLAIWSRASKNHFLMLDHSVFRYVFEVFSSGAFVDAWVGDDAKIAKSCKKHWFLRCDLLPRLRRPPCEGSKCGSTRVARLALKACRKATDRS